MDYEDVIPHEGRKVCVRCKLSKVYSPDPARSGYYVRTGFKHPVKPEHYYNECKACKREISRQQTRAENRLTPAIKSEALAINYLSEKGVCALPGRVFGFANADVVAWGCVRIGVSYCVYSEHHNGFQFPLAGNKIASPVVPDVMLLIADWIDSLSFHFFDANAAVFYIGDRRKKAVKYIPDANARYRRRDNVLDDEAMKIAKTGYLWLIEEYRQTWAQRWERQLTEVSRKS